MWLNKTFLLLTNRYSKTFLKEVTQTHGFRQESKGNCETVFLQSWMPLTVVLEKTLESPLDCKEIQPVHSEGDQPWDFFGRNDAKAGTPILWPPHAKSWLIGKDWCWEGLGAGGEGDDRGWDGWMASPTRWTWVWVNSGSWWWTGRPGLLRFSGLQRVRRLSDWTELIHLSVGAKIQCFLSSLLVLMRA